jgi:hypothetical protein
MSADLPIPSHAPALVMSPSSNTARGGGWDNAADLVYLFSCPLVFGNKTNFAMLDIDAVIHHSHLSSTHYPQ